jgi:hypothetical protein
MHTLSDAVGLPLIAETDRQPGTTKTPYRGWVWLATFFAGTSFWVALGYGIWALVAG